MTAVLKKQSPNGRITVYLSHREFVNESGVVKPIDGVVLIDTMNLKERKVFALVVLTFRYGREDEEVMGLKFYTEAILDFKQVYPHEGGEKDDLTAIQQHLIRKLGNESVYPITISVSSQAPHSVRLKPARLYYGSPLGVTYDLKVFAGSRPDEKPHKRATVRLALRCVHYVPNPESLLSCPSQPPTASIHKAFVFSQGKLELIAVLDREVYYQGEPLQVHVTVNNNCNRTVHKIRVFVVQHVNVCMFTNGHFKNIVAFSETEDRHPISPGASLSRNFILKPMSFLKYPVALAIEGAMPDDNMSLAPSTLPAYVKDKNPYGVTVSYEVKVKAILGYVDRPVNLWLPFKLLNKDIQVDIPVEELDSSRQAYLQSDDIEPVNDYPGEDNGSVVLIPT